MDRTTREHLGHQSWLDCITVDLNDDRQALKGVGEGTVGSCKRHGPGAGFPNSGRKNGEGCNPSSPRGPSADVDRDDH